MELDERWQRWRLRMATTRMVAQRPGGNARSPGEGGEGLAGAVTLGEELGDGFGRVDRRAAAAAAGAG